MMLLDRDPSAEVLTAGDVPTTLELIGREGETADLLILDLNLPGVEGTELMEEIVRRQPMLKILVLSGLTDRGRIMRTAARRSGLRAEIPRHRHAHERH